MMRARERSKCVKNSYHVVITSIYVGISIGECNEVKLDQTVEHHRDKTEQFSQVFNWHGFTAFCSNENLHTREDLMEMTSHYTELKTNLGSCLGLQTESRSKRHQDTY